MAAERSWSYLLGRPPHISSFLHKRAAMRPPMRSENRHSIGTRWMATVSEIPIPGLSAPAPVKTHDTSSSSLVASVIPPAPELDLQQPPSTVLTTIFRFPSMEPIHFAYYPTQHLHLPLRKDLLHRAVVYEGDRTRQGTASSKWRSEVHGSHSKMHPQKGTGRARAGDKQSPIRRGGGVAFGPKPRDFSTELPKKMYDKAFRTALSFRYRRGELLVVDEMKNPRSSAPYWMKQIFETNGWGNADKRSLLVAGRRRYGNKTLFDGVERIGEDGRILTVDDVDVKDLLGMGRVIVEYEALNELLRRHSKDLIPPARAFAAPEPATSSLW